MCDPVSIGVGVSVLTTAYGINEQREAAQDTNAFNAAQAGRVRESANRAARERNKAIIARRVELREQAAGEIQNVSRQAIKASGLTRLEGAGGSVGAILASIASQEIGGKTSVERGQEFGELQDRFEFNATAEQAYGRALQAERAPVLAPNLLGSVLRVGAAGYSAYMQGQLLERPNTQVRATPKKVPQPVVAQPINYHGYPVPNYI